MPVAIRQKRLRVVDLGVLGYRRALEVQHQVHAERCAGRIEDTLLLVEHPPVYTVGRRARAEELPHRRDWYFARGVEIEATDRGGRVTYHGPGQLVAYPIVLMDLTAGNVARYVASLEQAVSATLAQWGAVADVRRDGQPGVWLGRGKIASIGVRISSGVSTHGVSINVTNDLRPFEWIVPCGSEGSRASSFATDIRRAVSLDQVKDRFAESLADVLGLQADARSVDLNVLADANVGTRL